jgi:hypothetical protein
MHHQITETTSEAETNNNSALLAERERRVAGGAHLRLSLWVTLAKLLGSTVCSVGSVVPVKLPLMRMEYCHMGSPLALPAVIVGVSLNTTAAHTRAGFARYLRDEMTAGRQQEPVSELRGCVAGDVGGGGAVAFAVGIGTVWCLRARCVRVLLAGRAGAPVQQSSLVCEAARVLLLNEHVGEENVGRRGAGHVGDGRSGRGVRVWRPQQHRWPRPVEGDVVDVEVT